MKNETSKQANRKTPENLQLKLLQKYIFLIVLCRFTGLVLDIF